MPHNKKRYFIVLSCVFSFTLKNKSENIYCNVVTIAFQKFIKSEAKINIIHCFSERIINFFPKRNNYFFKRTSRQINSDCRKYAT